MTKAGKMMAVVAPRAGAWIETGSIPFLAVLAMSRPARARGLKHVQLAVLIALYQSRPARARGLKR